MLERLVHLQPLELRLLSAGHDIDVVAAAEAVIEEAQQAVTVRRIVDADGIASACQCVVHKAGGLVTKTIMVVSPYVACEQNVQGCDRPAPGILAALFPPLGMLGQHGIDNLSESLIAHISFLNDNSEFSD